MFDDDLTDQQRDHMEESFNLHTIHTGDGEINYCDDLYCPSYVQPWDRDPTLERQDRMTD